MLALAKCRAHDENTSFPAVKVVNARGTQVVATTVHPDAGIASKDFAVRPAWDSEERF